MGFRADLGPYAKKRIVISLNVKADEIELKRGQF